MSTINKTTEPVDMTFFSVDVIANHFYNLFNINLLQEPDLRRDDFYCGITNNIPNNLSRHSIKGYFFCAYCASKDIAGQVEAKLGEMGFDIGEALNPAGNGGADDSTIVYMAYKEPGFKQ